MTLSPARPVPPASSPQQQRLEVELLLGEAVLRPEELQAADRSLRGAPDLPETQRWHQLGCLPLRRSGGTVVVAVPTHWGNQERESLLRELTSMGAGAHLRLALTGDLNEALQAWDQEPSPPSEPRQADAGGVAGQDGAGSAEAAASPFPLTLLDDLQLPGDDDRMLEVVDPDDLESSARDANSSPVVSLVDRVLIQALTRGASDIHIEPQDDGLLIRFREDGVLQQQVRKLPRNLVPAVTSRLKIMADLDIAERRLPQDGRIRRNFRGRTMDFRVSTLPSRYGEKVCLRLLDSGSTQLGLDSLITDPGARAIVRELGHKPFGMVLVTGPTGSGKSTTLYALLAERNDPTINISTVEDPIEYTLKGITQTQVNRDKGLDFSTALRAFMRQDPDVLLVGETRDLETAKTAIEAALTGHLVLTTLHCNDAASAIARLDEMGMEPFMVSASLLGIVSQRLVRRVCPTCRISYRPNPEDLGRFGLLASLESQVSFYKARRAATGEQVCPTCQGRGYQGRVGVYEILRMTESIASAVAKRASTDVIRRMALENGMKTLLGYGLDLVRSGHTTLEEVERMLLTDTGLESERRARALSTLTCKGCGAGLRDDWLECPYCLTVRS